MEYIAVKTTAWWRDLKPWLEENVNMAPIAPNQKEFGSWRIHPRQTDDTMVVEFTESKHAVMFALKFST